MKANVALCLQDVCANTLIFIELQSGREVFSSPISNTPSMLVHVQDMPVCFMCGRSRNCSQKPSRVVVMSTFKVSVFMSG